MLEQLVEVFKIMGVIAGIMLLGIFIGSIIATPFRKRKQEKQKQEFINALDKIGKECIEALKKEQENKTKTTKKTIKSKEK